MTAMRVAGDGGRTERAPDFPHNFLHFCPEYGILLKYFRRFSGLLMKSGFSPLFCFE
jgi:hypothetical protein